MRLSLPSFVQDTRHGLIIVLSHSNGKWFKRRASVYVLRLDTGLHIVYTSFRFSVTNLANLKSTSPSIYFHLNTLSATNKCGPLGPTASNAIFAYNLNDVSTLKPTPIGVTTEYRRETAQLQLSDLAYSCPSTEPTEEEAKSYVQNDVNRCNPRLAWPMDFKRFGYPYWKHCGSHNYKFGVYDPPR